MNQGTRILALHGAPGVGKDYLADLLIERESTHKSPIIKLAYADKLYAEVAEAFGVTADELRSREWKKSLRDELRLSECRDHDFVLAMRGGAHKTVPRMEGEHIDGPLSSRFVLRAWGTEYRRRQRADYFVSHLYEVLLPILASSPRRVIITDVRTFDEAALPLVLSRRLRLPGPLPTATIEIVGAAVERMNAAENGELHSSDRRIPGYLIDATVANPGVTDSFYAMYRERYDSLYRAASGV